MVRLAPTSKWYPSCVNGNACTCNVHQTCKCDGAPSSTYDVDHNGNHYPQPVEVGSLSELVGKGKEQHWLRDDWGRRHVVGPGGVHEKCHEKSCEKSCEFVWCVLRRREHRLFITFVYTFSHAPLGCFSHAVSHAAFSRTFSHRCSWDYTTLVCMSSGYGFAENRRPPQTKEQ